VNPLFGWGLALLAVAGLGYVATAGPACCWPDGGGVLAAAAVQPRAARDARRRRRPVGTVPSAVMLHARLQPA
jgi:hypothetical protein